MAGYLWNHEETQVLLDLWWNAIVQNDLEGVKRNKAAFLTLAKKINEVKYKQTWQQSGFWLKRVSVAGHHAEIARTRPYSNLYIKIITRAHAIVLQSVYQVLTRFNHMLAWRCATLGGLSATLRLRAHTLFQILFQYKDYYTCTCHSIAICVPGTNEI